MSGCFGIGQSAAVACRSRAGLPTTENRLNRRSGARTDAISRRLLPIATLGLVLAIGFVLPVAAQPSITVAKSAADISEANTATYTFTVTNTSVAPVTIASVVDDVLGDLTAAALAANGGSPIQLEPGASFTFSVNSAVLNAGTVVNTVTVTGYDDEGTPATATDTHTLTVFDVAPSITADKSADDNIPEGNTTTYTFTIANTSVGTDPVTVSADDSFIGNLLAGLVMPFGSMVIMSHTTGALNAGTVVNVLTVTGHDDEGTEASASDFHTLTVSNVAPSITVDKTGPALIPEGSAATYGFTITNTSVGTDPVSITSVVDDVLGDLTAAAQAAWVAQGNSGPIVLAPGASFTFSVTTGVLNAGTVVNVVTVTGYDDEGAPATATDTHTLTVFEIVPVATDDSSSGNATGTPVTVPVLVNDTTGSAVVPSTVQIVGTAAPGASLVVPGQGTWSVDPTTGAITFTPEAGYTGDPTPIQYTVRDAEGHTSNPASVTIDYNQYPPVAVNDSSLHNAPGPVTLSVTANDTDPNGDLDPGTVDLDPATPGQQTTLIVAGEGAWATDALGNVTFSPQAGFTHDPAPIPYTVSDATGLVSNQAVIAIDYSPVAADDSSSGNLTGMPVTVPVLANDTTGDAAVPASVQIVGTAAAGDPLVVAGQGTWSVNPVTGAITFTPQAGYTGDPTPIQYTVRDEEGNTSNPTSVTIDYSQYPPVAVDDSSLHNAPGPVTLSVTANDTDADGDLVVGSVDLDPATAGQQTALTAAGEGAWATDALGNVTFTPQAGFTHDPAPIPYTVSDQAGRVSNQATITIDYIPLTTNDDISGGNATGTAVTVDVLANDTNGDAAVPASVQIVGTAAAGDPLVVAGQGTWSVNPATGAITFTPQAGYTGDPTPIQYTVEDAQANISAPASVIVAYDQQPPVAVDDSSTGNPPGPVTLSVTANDTDPNGDLDPGTVDLDPATAGQQTTLTVAGEGTWSVDASGNVTFTPDAGFWQNPTPISYTVSDASGLVSGSATIAVLMNGGPVPAIPALDWTGFAFLAALLALSGALLARKGIG